jgi:hypothetical protein
MIHPTAPARQNADRQTLSLRRSLRASGCAPVHVDRNRDGLGQPHVGQSPFVLKEPIGPLCAKALDASQARSRPVKPSQGQSRMLNMGFHPPNRPHFRFKPKNPPPRPIKHPSPEVASPCPEHASGEPVEPVKPRRAKSYPALSESKGFNSVGLGLVLLLGSGLGRVLSVLIRGIRGQKSFAVGSSCLSFRFCDFCDFLRPFGLVAAGRVMHSCGQKSGSRVQDCKFRSAPAHWRSFSQNP